NIFNAGFILGVTAMVTPLAIQKQTLRLELPVMLAATLLLYLVIGDLRLGAGEGAVMLTGLMVFTGWLLWDAKRNPTSSIPGDNEGTASFGRIGATGVLLNAGAVLLGVGLLALGADLLVRGAVSLATYLGVSETVIGLTIVSAGTSAPELAASLVAAWRGRADMAVANVIGSNIFNILGIASVTALVAEMPVDPLIRSRDTPWLLGLSALLVPIMATGRSVTRREGALLSSVFAIYLVVLVGV
ncbi:MAG: cation:H+ antiporter, partial [Myxococcota bacterium]